MSSANHDAIRGGKSKQKEEGSIGFEDEEEEGTGSKKRSHQVVLGDSEDRDAEELEMEEFGLRSASKKKVESSGEVEGENDMQGFELSDGDKHSEKLTVNEESDFKYHLKQWLKQDKHHDVEVRRKLTRSIFGQRIDAYYVHVEVQRRGEYKNVRNNEKDLLDLIKCMPGEKRTNMNRNLNKYKKTISEFVTELESFVKYWKNQNDEAKKTLENSSSLMDLARKCLSDRRQELAGFFENEISAKGKKKGAVIDPRATNLIVSLIEELDTALLRLDDLQEEEASQFRRILWLGENGIGKSFMLNLLLLLSEEPSWQYGRGHEEWEAIRRNEQKDQKDEEKDYETKYVTRDQISPEELPLPTAKVAIDLVVIKPGDRDFSIIASDNVSSSSSLAQEGSIPSREEIDFEREYLDAVRNRAVDYVHFHRLAKKRGNVLPGYILTSASQESVRSTTMHITRIRKGSRWHFAVQYMSLQELEEKLRRYDFAHSDQAFKAGKLSDRPRSQYHEHMMRLLEMVVDRDATLRARGVITDTAFEQPGSSELAEEVDLEEEESDSRSILFPKEKESIRFKDIVERIAGKTFVFVGKGQDALEDRIYIRRMLHGVLFQGLFSGFAPPPGTSGAAAKPVANDAAPDRFIISQVTVYAPSILLDGDVEWQDAPGSHDPDPTKSLILQEGLENCDGLVMLSSREQDPSVLDPFSEFVVPRLWQKSEDISRFSHFLLTEKAFTDDYLSLARRKLLSADEMQMQRVLMMKTMFNKIMSAKMPPVPEKELLARDAVKSKANRELNAGTWKIYPFMYTSLLLNSSLVLTFDRVSQDEWNAMDRPELRGNAPLFREAARQALIATFGRNVVDALLAAAQSTTQDVLRHVRSVFQAKQKEGALHGEGNLSEPPPERLKEAARKIENRRGRKDADSGRKWEGVECEKYSERFRDAERKASELVMTEDYLTRVESKFRSEVLGKMRSENNPDLAADFVLQEKHYGGRRIFMQDLSRIDFSRVVDRLQLAVSDNLKDFEGAMKKFLRKLLLDHYENLKAEAAGAQKGVKRSKRLAETSSEVDKENEPGEWLDRHLDYFMATQGRARICEKLKGNLALAFVPSSSTASSVDGNGGWEEGFKEREDLRKRLIKELKDAARKAAEAEYAELSHLVWARGSLKMFKSKGSDAEKTALVVDQLERKLQDVGPRFKRRVVSAIHKVLDYRFSFAALVNGNSTGAVSVLTTQFRNYIRDFRAWQNAKQEVVQGLTHALGFINNRVTELLMNDNLAEVDGFWFECWAKSKFVLEGFRQAHGPVSRLLLDGAHGHRKESGARDPKVPLKKLGARGDFIPAAALLRQDDRSWLGSDEGAVIEGDSDTELVSLMRSTSSEKTVGRSQIDWMKVENLHLKEAEGAKYRIKILTPVNDGLYYDCEFIDRSPLDAKGLFHTLHEQAREGPWTARNLVQAVLKCVDGGLERFEGSNDASTLAVMTCWAKLIDAAFPVIEKTKIHASARRAEQGIKTYDVGDGHPVRACEEVFNFWFKPHFNLDDFLRDFAKNLDSTKFVVPLLLGAAEMMATPFLVSFESTTRAFLIEPVFRKSRYSARRPHRLRWLLKKGFQVDSSKGRYPTESVRSRSPIIILD